MVICFVSKTKKIAKRSSRYLEGALYLRLFKDGGSESSVKKQLDSFLKSRKLIYKWELDTTIRKLRDRGLYFPALKLSEMMAYRGINKTVSDQAIHLDLIAKSKGISAAEDYFVSLADSSKNHLCYGAMLNCYCKELMAEEAEALMEKMKELNVSLTSMHYNSLMTLYLKTGQPEKIPAVIQEMKASGVMLDCFSYNVWMRSHAAENDVKAVERVIDEMKRDGRVDGDWTTYSNLASIYVEAGLIEKAEIALKELEKRNVNKDHSAFQFLITLYGRIGNLVEVYRVWRSLAVAFRKISNLSYLNMIQVLVKLNDLSGAENCFKEWQENCGSYDIRIANALIGGYVKEGFLDKALELKENSRERGAKPNLKTWEIFIDYYVTNGNFKLAVECFTNAIHTPRGNGEKWAPQPETVKSILRNFEQEKDVVGAEDLLDNLKMVSDKLEADVFESLIRTYAAAGKTSSSLSRRLKMEGVEVSEASKKLLETICVE